MMGTGFGGNAFGKIFFGNTNIKVYFGTTKVFDAGALANAPYLTFTSPSMFSISTSIKTWNGTLDYSTDGTSWTTWTGYTAINAALSGNEYRILMRGTNNTKIAGSSNFNKWVLTGNNIACIGNIENLLDYAKVAEGIHPDMAVSCFYCLFDDCTGLTAAPALPATTLTNSCYHFMFRGCTGLTTAPALPATVLADYCYYGMFRGCTGLTTAPALPCTKLASYCYYYMFDGCTGLTTAPALRAETLQSSCYSHMFDGCTGLTAAPALPAYLLASSCCSYMFNGCTKFKVSYTKTGTYTKEWRIPKNGDIVGNAPGGWNSNMLAGTGGTYTSNPPINTTYYVENDPVY